MNELQATLENKKSEISQLQAASTEQQLAAIDQSAFYDELKLKHSDELDAMAHVHQEQIAAMTESHNSKSREMNANIKNLEDSLHQESELVSNLRNDVERLSAMLRTEAVSVEETREYKRKAQLALKQVQQLSQVLLHI